MDTYSKNRLQEYCMKHKLPMPNYRITKRSGPIHALRFQAEVEFNGHWYLGDDLCATKKQAEQSAARKAWETNNDIDEKSITTQLSTVDINSDELDPPPPYSEVVKSDAIEHLPIEYADIEKYITIALGCFGGRIRKIWPQNSDGLYKFEVAGAYRYCDNVQRHHKRNQVYFMVDPINKTYYQMCHHRQCFGFRSVTRKITINRPPSMEEKQSVSIDQYLALPEDEQL